MTKIHRRVAVRFLRLSLFSLFISVFFSSQPSHAKLTQSDPVERGILKYKKGDSAGALSDFNAAISTNSRDLEALDNRAILFFQLGEKAKAFADLNRAIKLYPLDEFSYSKRGEFKRLTGDLAGSLMDYHKAVSINPKAEAALIGKARTEIELAAYKSAEVDLKKASALSPNDFQLQYLLIKLTRKQLHDVSTAQLLYNRMREMQTRSADDHFWLGSAHCVWDQPKLAEQEFSKTIKLAPYFNQAYCYRATIKNEFGDKQGALLDLNKAIDLSKGDPKAYFNRYILKKELGDPAGADADLQRALELNPKIKQNNTYILDRFIVNSGETPTQSSCA